MTEPDFWNDNIAAQKTSQELNGLKQTYETFNEMQELSDETELYLEMLDEDDSIQAELEETLEKLDKIMTSYEMTLLLSEPYDRNNAILEIHPGSGGTEAQDWADMLFRMYTRYGNAKGFKVETLDYQAGDEAGTRPERPGAGLRRGAVRPVRGVCRQAGSVKINSCPPRPKRVYYKELSL